MEVTIIAKHKTPPDAHVDFLLHPDSRNLLYDAFSIPGDERDPPGWLEGVYNGAQLGVWSRWTVSTPYGLVSCVYTLDVPPGVVHYLARNKSVTEIVDTIDLRLEQE
jgi:hypothetical protein